MQPLEKKIVGRKEINRKNQNSSQQVHFQSIKSSSLLIFHQPSSKEHSLQSSLATSQSIPIRSVSCSSGLLFRNRMSIFSCTDSSISLVRGYLISPPPPIFQHGLTDLATFQEKRL